MHAADQVAERSDLGRRVEPAHDEVREVEVAGERSRADARGERADASGGKRALVRQYDAVGGGERAELAEGGHGPVEARVVSDLRLDEERDQDRADTEVGCPGDRRAHVLGRRGRRPGVRGGDAAEVVLVEHEGGDLEPGRLARCPQRHRLVGPAEMPAEQHHLDAVAADPARTLERVEIVTAADHRVEDADLHRQRSASSTGSPVRADS